MEEESGCLLLKRKEKIYVEIFDEHASFVFFDSEENRYIGSVAYQLKPIWTKEQIQAYY